MDRLNQTIQRGRPVSSVDAAKANDVLEHFINAGTLKTILGNYRNMCELLHLKPTVFPLFYPKLKTNLNSWKAKALWKKFDARVGHKCYARGKVCPNTRVLIIGAGPCGLRTAIEAQLLGAKVVVIEKRDRMSRNNVLHLWPFVIEDLRALGAKKFFGKFCAGAIDHISIRQLQCILLKAALLLGVEVHTEVSFEKLVEPNITEKIGWRAEFKPSDHPVSQYEFDVIIGADGKRNTLQGFKRKEFRGKLAIAITANFINKRTEAEARVEEISGVAFIFNQKFFKELNAETGIDLENIVYYKDDTHYFVMTAKKPSLIDKGVIKQDYADTARLLSLDNVDREALLNYAREAADFSTNYQMPDLEFAVNHYGQPDVAMFDFTSMYAAENASKVIERHGYKLLMTLVGDSLLEPFWPTGSGCARGFLSSLDACWAIKAWGSGQVTPLEVLAERESIYRLLAQTTPENLNKDCKAYTVDPSTRYPNLNKAALMPQQVLSLYDTDDPSGIELTSRAPQPVSTTESHRKRRRRDTHLDPNTLITWIKEQIREYEELIVEDVTSSFKDGRVLCAILHHYRPDLVDYSAIKAEDVAKNNQLAFDLLEKEIGISPVMTGEDMAKAEVPDYLTMFSYLTQIYDTFRGEIPHIKHPKLASSSPPRAPKCFPFTKPSTIPTTPETKSGITRILQSKPPSPVPKNKESETSFESKKNRPKSPKPPPKTAIFEAERKRKARKITSLQSQLSTVISIVPTVVAKELFDNFCSHDNCLNCKPVKSIEENGVGTKKKVGFEGELGDINFSDEKLNKCLDLDKIKSIQDWIASMTETTNFSDNKITFCGKNFKEINLPDLNGKKNTDNSLKSHRNKELKLFDENFKEINCELISNLSGESQKTSSENTKLETKITMTENNNEVSKAANNDATKTDKASLNNNLKSDIIVRCTEEDCQSISVRELKFCSCSNTFFINKPKKRLKMKKIKFRGLPNQITHAAIKNKQQEKHGEHVCHFLDLDKFKFLYLSNMSGGEPETVVVPELTYDRIIDWINHSDFKERDGISEMGGDFLDTLSDITSVTKILSCDRDNEQIKKEISEASSKPEEIKTKQVKCINEATVSIPAPSSSMDSIAHLMEKLKSKVNTFPRIGRWGRRSLNKLTASEPTSRFAPIAECEETDLPEPKETSKPMPNVKVRSADSTSAVISRYTTNRPKRHAEPISSSKPAVSQERRTKKRRSFEKYDLGGVEERRKRLEEIAVNRADRQNKRRQQRRMQTDQFIKSMQMLQANAKPDKSEPFEDYSIFVYRQTAPHFQDRVKNFEQKFKSIPDRENRLPSQSRAAGGADEEFAARIKDLEDKWRDPIPIDKKPKDLLRAIGKIETSDWNIKEIEKKIMENKLGKVGNKEKERVPKWNREQFLARQTKLEKLDRQASLDGKYSEFDKGIKHLDQRLKEGSVRDLGQNKVASITEKLATKAVEPEPPKPVQKSNSKPAVVLPTQGGSEYCHFCQKRVYLMERLSAEGRFFHRGCFKCQYCHTTLRLGSYLFDRDGQYGHRFYCSQHFGMPGELYPLRVERKVLKKENVKPLEKLKIVPLTGVEGVDLLDRVQTPERIEFANLSAGHISSDHDESLSQMDEDEWTDRNFGASTAEVCSSDEDEDSSSLSGSESDNEDAFEEALEEPPTKEGTLRWMERYKQRYSKERRGEDDSDSEDYSSSSDHSSYYENSSGDEEDEPATEGEEEIRARELRKQEVRVEPPVVQTDTGSDTEIVSDESSPESSSKHNSATEISTDSEFAVDEPTPTREIPSIVFNDFNVTKTRGNYGPPKKVQVKSGVLQSPINGKPHKRGIKLEFTPLVPSPVLPKPAPTSLLARTEGYALNRTQSTGGIATKVSLELKKKYLLGDSGVPGSIQKSGSVSTLDSKFKSFHTNISDCQKLLKPAPEISPSMQVFCNKLNEVRSPLSPITSKSSPFSDNQPPKSPDIVKSDLSPSKKKTTPEVIDLTVSPEQPDVTKYTKESPPKVEEQPAAFEHELEGRPRSPVKEIPIIVPNIDWSQANKPKDSDISSDSLTSDSDSEEHTGIQKSPTVKIFNSIPRVEVCNDAGEILQNSGDEIALDSLCPENNKQTSPPSDAPKSITSEKKTLNQPKTLPGLQSEHVHAEFHEKTKILASPESESKYIVSGQSTPSEHESYVEHTGAAMTETELSDWARDSAVSDDFEDVEFELNPEFVSLRKNRKPKCEDVIKANIEEFEELGHVCGKEKQIKDFKNKMSLGENLSSILSSIEFMDTGEETSSDEKVLVEATMKNNGYVEFQNEDDIAEDSLNPNINNIIETVNPEVREKIELHNLSSLEKNTGYCIIGNEINEDNFGAEVIDLKETDLEKLKEKRNHCDNEEDSLLVVETGTTTEENTCSDSTVKNLIEKDKVSEKEKKDLLNATSLINENKHLLDKIREEQKIFDDKQETKKIEDSNHNLEYEEHCQRLQSKVEFGNVRDSIDIRKSKRKDKVELPPSSKPDLIQEEIIVNPIQTMPKAIYTKEEIKKSRDENQKLVQEMVMNKMKAQNRSLERKKRSRNSFSPSLSPSRPFDLSKSATTDLSPQSENKRISTYSTSSSVYSTPDVLLSISTKDTPKRAPIPLEKSHTITAISELNKDITSTPVSSIKQHPKSFTKQLSIHSSFQTKPKNSSLPEEAFSLPDIQQALLNDFKTPIAPPRQRGGEEAKRTAEKLKQDARAKARLMSNEDLGLSPEDKLKKLREKLTKRENENDVHVQDSIESLVINTERRNSVLYSNDTLKKKRNNLFKRSKSGDDTLNLPFNSFSVSSKHYPVRTKSVSEISKPFAGTKLTEIDLNIAGEEEIRNKLQFCKSDPNLLTEAYTKVEKKSKTKDRERRKSITKLISEFFGKKKEGGKNTSGSTSKGFLSRISPKSKSKSMINLTGKNADKITEEIPRTNSFADNLTHYRQTDNVSPPPIPPLPLNYTGSGPSRCTDDSSDGENDWRHQERSSCDTLDQSGVQEGRRVSRTARKAARQAQLKRHRMAQEIQRKLEETEVKTRELEQRGVKVEKALRGESSDAQNMREECDLLKEWFDLMRDLTELRRYERELMVRAQELELEDRHARLQQELRERLDNEDHKTKEDVKMESSIINEMMEIVAKRDSLIALLEQDRLRYSDEDRDFEEQMLAKGLRLTPLRKTPDK